MPSASASESICRFTLKVVDGRAVEFETPAVPLLLGLLLDERIMPEGTERVASVRALSFCVAKRALESVGLVEVGLVYAEPMLLATEFFLVLYCNKLDGRACPPEVPRNKFPSVPSLGRALVAAGGKIPWQVSHGTGGAGS